MSWELRCFIFDVWKQIMGRPDLKPVCVVIGPGAMPGSIQYKCVAFKLGRFGRSYANLPTLLQFEHKFRARLERLGVI